MVLFFILAMTAAYTNRSLIVEQRSASNNLRAAQALEATDAGVEWVLIQLNGPQLTTSCAASASAGDTEFRSRYLILNTDDGTYDVRTYDGVNAYAPSCVAADHGNWSCSCPIGLGASKVPTLNVTADGNGQAFRALFVPAGNLNLSPTTHVGPGVVQLLVQGCSNLGSGDTSCIQPIGVNPNVDAYNRAQVWLGLVKALPSVPPAAVTAGGSILVSAGTTLTVVNADPATGLTIHAANGFDPASVQLTGPPGTPSPANQPCPPPPPASAPPPVNCDATLPPMRTDPPNPPKPVMFDATFGMDADSYKRQPGVVFVDCAAGCTSASISDALARFPGRVIWADGNLDLDGGGAIGSAAYPAMIVSNGTITVSSAVTYNGFLFGNAIVWSNAGASVNGALVSATDFTVNANATVSYDAALLNLINLGYGSFVRIPGGSGQF